MINMTERADQAYLLKITGSHYGIHLRLETYLQQAGTVSDSIAALRRIMLDDLWFYRQTADPGHSLSTLLGLARALLDREQAHPSRLRLLATVVDFLVSLGESGAEHRPAAALPAAPLSAGIELLEKMIAKVKTDVGQEMAQNP